MPATFPSRLKCEQTPTAAPDDISAKQSVARREVLATSVGATLLATPFSPAHALLSVKNPDGGGEAVAYELPVEVRILALQGSVPSNWLPEFRKTQYKSSRVHVSQKPELVDIYNELQKRKAMQEKMLAGAAKGKGKASDNFDVCTLGDSWLTPAISKGLLSPMTSPEYLELFRTLPVQMQQLARRDKQGQLSSNGSVWGLPYRWGSTLFAYRVDKLQQRKILPPADWADLWRPEFKGRIAMVDSPREVVGAALKACGLTYNTPDIAAAGCMPDVSDRLQALMQQVKFFSNTEMLKALAAGEVFVVVGWSPELLSAAMKSTNVGIVMPASGTSLWADLWTLPANLTNRPSPLASQWIEFTLKERRMQKSRGLRGGASPLMLPSISSKPQAKGAKCQVKTASVESDYLDYNTAMSRRKERDRDLVNGLMPSTEILAASEFLLPLSNTANAQYRQLITTMNTRKPRS